MTPDQQYMRRALDLARAGVGLVSPNPAVGAVLADASGHEIGAGTHTYDGLKHAEVLALEQAGERARGATLYLNLEPCSHQGRTGPCADAVIAAGVRRVVCSMHDPNPRVAGTGFAKLQAAGIVVEVGLFADEAKKLNESFAKYIVTNKPFVTLKSALTLDGKIAPAPDTKRSGQHFITGELARAHVQQLRHESDAILVGVGTVLADDPLLTDRSGLPRRRKLLRVILDSHLRIPIVSRVIQTAEDDVLVLCSKADDAPRSTFEQKGVRVVEVTSGPDGRPSFAAILETLAKMQMTSLLIEGGSRANASALASGEVDKLFLYFAPKVLGEEAVPFLEGDLQLPMNLHNPETHQFGKDFAVEGYLRDPYSS